jgi:hypothetical protein
MKAIQIKYLSATNTKCARLKVWAEGVKPVVYSAGSFCTNSMQSVELQAAYKFADNHNFLQGGEYKLEIGVLPNLDHCAVIVSK